MLKLIVASKLSKAAALCVCPIIGASVVATNVPQLRNMVHKATAPKRKMAAKPASERERPFCPEPVSLAMSPISLPRLSATAPEAVTAPEAQASIFRIQGAKESRASHTTDFPAEENRSFVGLPLLRRPLRSMDEKTIEQMVVDPATTPMFAAPAGVPEPSTWLQISAGLGLVGAAARTARAKREADCANAHGKGAKCAL